MGAVRQVLIEKRANYYKGSRWSYNSAGAIEYCDGQNNPDAKFTLIIGYLLASYPGLLLAKLSFPMARVPTQNFARKPGAVGAIFSGGRHIA